MPEIEVNSFGKVLVCHSAAIVCQESYKGCASCKLRKLQEEHLRQARRAALR